MKYCDTKRPKETGNLCVVTGMRRVSRNGHTIGLVYSGLVLSSSFCTIQRVQHGGGAVYYLGSDTTIWSPTMLSVAYFHSVR